MSVSVMKKLTVLASVRDADRLVRRLMRLRCAELRSVPLGDLPDGGTLLRYDCDRDRAEAERRVADVTAAMPILDTYTVKAKPWNRKPIRVSAEEFRASGRLEAARATVAEVLKIRDGQVAAQNEYNRLEALCRSLTPWMEYAQPLEGEGTDLCEVWLGTLPPKTLISQAEDALSSLHAGVEEVYRDKEGLYVSVSLISPVRNLPRPRNRDQTFLTSFTHHAGIVLKMNIPTLYIKAENLFSFKYSKSFNLFINQNINRV